LRQLVFDLGTEIEDLEGETLRFNALADELQQTAIVAGADPSENGRFRQLQAEQYDYSGQLEDSLRILKNQESLLRNGNERISSLNGMLRSSVLGWLGLNENLSDENLALLRNITFLNQENFELLNAQGRLFDQISSLNATLDTYKDLLDNHSDLNGELNETTSFLESEIDRLVAANEEYKNLNDELTDSISDLADQNTDLVRP
jgi:chromosome segregation ATPase